MRPPKSPPPASTPTPGERHPPAARDKLSREARLTAALKENLKRRKQKSAKSKKP